MRNMKDSMQETFVNRNCLIISLLIVCGLLTGCQDKADVIKRDVLMIMSDEPLIESQEVNHVGVYVDVTLSMRGFLGMDTDSYRKLVGETRYMQCLDEVNEIISIMYDKDMITYYRVDTPTWRTQENVLSEAKKREYYFDSREQAEKYELVDLIEEDDEGVGSWCISNTLRKCKDDDFSVFITDFYENRRKTSNVISELKENITLSEIPGGKTVGIIGIRSQYAGTVFDYDNEKEGVEYGIVNGDVTEDDICYRQFFVIVIGFPREIQDFCKQLQENMNIGENDIKYAIFYENEIYGLDYTDFNLCYSRNMDSDDSFWQKGNVTINDSSTLPIYSYENKTVEGKDVVISYKVEGVSLREELQNGKTALFTLPDIGEKELTEVAYYIEEQKISLWAEDEGCYEVNMDYANMYRIENILYSQEERLLYVWFKVFKKNIPESSIKLSCQVHLERAGNTMEEWWEDWNVENNVIDYGKTRNLKEYFQAIKNKMPERNNILLDFVFYIEY